jgi:hypothetical protein
MAQISDRGNQPSPNRKLTISCDRPLTIICYKGGAIARNALISRHLLPRCQAYFENCLQLLPSFSIKPTDINHALIAMNALRADFDPKLIAENAKNPNIGSILRNIEAQVPFDILSKLPTKITQVLQI